MGRGSRNRKDRKHNGAQGKNLTASTADGKVSEPSFTMVLMASASTLGRKQGISLVFVL
ncbi:hypothetical protein COLO4_09509 [Corchorus olitorius]|uniref:Uncharacterized protein n=1 Tax=Corchorus olitorius TaxID=93759 RepID=A0A1R3KBV9_9ROSI|nr:hypothetical protein COLO4_09509 [Corchorus olitorius]